jgi:hypothetical protein
MDPRMTVDDTLETRFRAYRHLPVFQDRCVGEYSPTWVLTSANALKIAQ